MGRPIKEGGLVMRGRIASAIVGARAWISGRGWPTCAPETSTSHRRIVSGRNEGLTNDEGGTNYRTDEHNRHIQRSSERKDSGIVPKREPKHKELVRQSPSLMHSVGKAGQEFVVPKPNEPSIDPSRQRLIDEQTMEIVRPKKAREYPTQKWLGGGGQEVE